jgi:hypothetical protein
MAAVVTVVLVVSPAAGGVIVAAVVAVLHKADSKAEVATAIAGRIHARKADSTQGTKASSDRGKLWAR